MNEKGEEQENKEKEWKKSVTKKRRAKDGRRSRVRAHRRLRGSRGGVSKEAKQL